MRFNENWQFVDGSEWLKYAPVLAPVSKHPDFSQCRFGAATSTVHTAATRFGKYRSLVPPERIDHCDQDATPQANYIISQLKVVI